MADNYLEKRYDEVFGKGGGRNAGPSRPSLDVLVRKQSFDGSFDPSYKVHHLQLEAIAATLRSWNGAEGLCVEVVSEGGASGIRISGTEDLMLIGECVAIIKLKATELGLGGIYSENGFTVIGKPVQASR